MRKTVINLLYKPATRIVVSILIGFIMGAVVLAIAGYNPIEAYGVMLGGIFNKPKYIAQIAINAVPIMLTGLSIAFAAKTGLFNIGAEGQYIVGTVTAAIVGRYVLLPAGIHPLFVMICAFAFGGIYGGLAGYLKTRYGIHEVISTIMLNWIALYLNNFILTLPGVKKEGAQASQEVLQSARTTILSVWKKSPEGKAFIKGDPIWGDMLKTDLHWGILIAVLAVLFIWFFLRYTTKGFELRAVGQNQNAAQFAGIDAKKNTVLAMFMSGGIAAMAGALQILGTNGYRISVLAAQEGYGWDGISVALIANNNPISCIVSSLLFSSLKYGGGSIQSEIGAPSEIINIMIGIIVFCIALTSVYPMIAERLKKKGEVAGYHE